MITSIKLTVFFSDPFWIGVFETWEENIYRVSKVTFGQEPKDIEIYQFLLRNFYSLQFSKEQSGDTLKNVDKKENPKRIQRKIKKETKSSGIGTKAQVALKKQYEDNKKTRKQRCKQQKEEEIKRKFQLKQKKRKNKH